MKTKKETQVKTKKEKRIQAHSAIRFPAYMQEFIQLKDINFSMLVRCGLDAELMRLFGREYVEFKNAAEIELKDRKLTRK